MTKPLRHLFPTDEFDLFDPPRRLYAEALENGGTGYSLSRPAWHWVAYERSHRAEFHPSEAAAREALLQEAAS